MSWFFHKYITAGESYGYENHTKLFHAICVFDLDNILYFKILY